MSLAKPLPTPIASASGDTLDRICRYLVPLLIAVAAAIVPPDANFDLANYHYYNAWAFLNDRYQQDFFPANIQSFFNPLMDVPFYWANTHLPGRLVAFLLGIGHGLCFLMLYMLGRALLFRLSDWKNIAAAACIAVAGLTSATSISELGTTYYDYVGACGAMFCLLLLARGVADPAAGLRLPRIALAGLVLGLVVGLKQTNVFLAVGIGLALPLLADTMRRRLEITATFAAAGLIGVLATGGPWMLHLWLRFGNPVFPFFNGLFHSPFAPTGDLRYLLFMPHGWLETLLYPFVFTLHPQRISEVPMRDLRLLALFVTIPIGALLLVITRKTTAEDRERQARRRFLAFLLAALALSYVGWLLLFSTRRYALVLEMLAPLVIALVAMELPARRGRGVIAAAVIGLLVITTLPRTEGRWEWHGFEGRIVDARLPDETFGNDMVLLVGWRPKSFLAPFFPPQVSFVRVSGADADDRALEKLSGEVGRRIAAHKGRFLVLVHQSELGSLGDLAAYGLDAPVEGCRAIHSTLDLKGPVMLCRAERRAPGSSG